MILGFNQKKKREIKNRKVFKKNDVLKIKIVRQLMFFSKFNYINKQIFKFFLFYAF